MICKCDIQVPVKSNNFFHESASGGLSFYVRNRLRISGLSESLWEAVKGKVRQVLARIHTFLKSFWEIFGKACLWSYAFFGLYSVVYSFIHFSSRSRFFLGCTCMIVFVSSIKIVKPNHSKIRRWSIFLYFIFSTLVDIFYPHDLTSWIRTYYFPLIPFYFVASFIIELLC